MRLLFSSDFAGRASQLFLHPDPRHSWAQIVTGVEVASQSGKSRRFSAAGGSTCRGFERVNQSCVGASEGFRRYFLVERSNLIKALSRVRTVEKLHRLENDICAEIRERLNNVKAEKLRPYNKVRKPVDLYMMNLVAMAAELDSQRARLTPLLFMPLDSKILGHADLFTKEQRCRYGVLSGATFKDITTEATYNALQELLTEKAQAVGASVGTAFARIYFELLWNDRYTRWGGNLFEANP